MTTNTAETLNKTSATIIEAAIEIHKAVGPGLLENAYLACLARDLRSRLRIEVQRAIPLHYKTVCIECAYRADMVVEESVVVEVKAIDALAPIHRQQMYTYLRFGDYPLGLILNFNAPTMKQGIIRVVNNFPDK